MPSMRSTFNTIPRNTWLLAALWLLVQAGMLLGKGITTDMEGQVYINVANHLLQYGYYEAPKSLFYSVPIVVLALCIKTGMGYTGFVVIQLLVNALATISFYKLGHFLSGNTKTATIATVLFMVFIPLQIWNTYLYTESLFISLGIIFSSWLLRCNLRPLLLPLVVAGLVVLTLTRPSGILFVVPAFIYVLQKLIVGRYAIGKRLAILSGAAAITVFFVNYLYRTGGGDLDVMKPYIEEHIICFMPTQQPDTHLQLAQTGQPIGDLWYYIQHNPAHFLRLFFLRLWAFINLARPYYSGMHNVALYLTMLPVYLFAIIGFCKKIQPGGRLYIGTLLLVYAGAIALQCDDYHSRFIMVLYPYILFFAAVGIGTFLYKIGFKKQVAEPDKM
jgi:hypothetical protein